VVVNTVPANVKENIKPITYCLSVGCERKFLLPGLVSQFFADSRRCKKLNAAHIGDINSVIGGGKGKHDTFVRRKTIYGKAIHSISIKKHNTQEQDSSIAYVPVFIGRWVCQ